MTDNVINLSERLKDKVAATKVQSEAMKPLENGFKPLSEDKLKFEFIDFSELNPRKYTWLCDKFFMDRGLVLVAGSRGQGKSTLFGHWAVQFAKGVITGEPVKVLYLTTEDSEEDILAPKFYINNDCQKITGIYTMKMTTPMGDLGDMEHLMNFDKYFESFAEQVVKQDIKVIFLDPIVTFIGIKDDANNAVNLRILLQKIGRFATDHGILIFAMKHFKKMQGSTIKVNSLDQIDGTGVWSQVARFIIGVWRLDDDLKEKLGLKDDDEATTLVKLIKNSYVDIESHPALAFKHETVTYTLGEQMNYELGRLVPDGTRRIWGGDVSKLSNEDTQETEKRTNNQAQVDQKLKAFLERHNGTAKQKEVAKIGNLKTLKSSAERLSVVIEPVLGGKNNEQQWRLPDYEEPNPLFKMAA